MFYSKKTEARSVILFDLYAQSYNEGSLIMPSAIDRPLPSGGPTAGGDEFDDLDNYDLDGPDDPFGDNYAPKNVLKETVNKEKNASGLGIDEEVEVVRKARAPRVKLDEHRYIFSATTTTTCTDCQKITFCCWNTKVTEEGKRPS